MRDETIEQARVQRTVRCPTCGGDSRYTPSNPYRPFCSDRCRNVDFGAWASESFRLAAKPSSDDLDADLGQLEDDSHR